MRNKCSFYKDSISFEEKIYNSCAWNIFNNLCLIFYIYSNFLYFNFCIKKYFKCFCIEIRKHISSHILNKND